MNLINSKAQVLLCSEVEDYSVEQNYRDKRSIGQTFFTGNLSGDLDYIEIKLADEPTEGGLLRIDIYEVRDTVERSKIPTRGIGYVGKHLIYLGSSHTDGYFWFGGKEINKRIFTGQIALKSNTEYAFLCNSTGRNTFHLRASNSDSYKDGTTFSLKEKPEKGEGVMNLNIIYQLDLWFRIAITTDGVKD